MTSQRDTSAPRRFRPFSTLRDALFARRPEAQANVERIKADVAREQGLAMLFAICRNLNGLANEQEAVEERGDGVTLNLLMEDADGPLTAGTYPLSEVFRGAARATFDAYKMFGGLDVHHP